MQAHTPRRLSYRAAKTTRRSVSTAYQTTRSCRKNNTCLYTRRFNTAGTSADIQDSVREALPEYDLQVVVGTKPITKDRIHDMLLGSGEEDDVRTDGGRSAGNPETRLGEARKQLRIVLDDVEFGDEDTAEYVEGALACAESAAVCLEGEDALDGEP